MTVVEVANEVYTGLAADTKPTTGIPAGAQFTETDTGVMSVWNGTTWVKCVVATNQAYGTSTTNGGSTTVTIAHGLASTPNFVSVQPKSADALGPFYFTVGATNITVTYGIATPSGTNNVSLWWEAKI